MSTKLNPILERVLVSDYEGGLKRFKKLKQPTPEDLRWAGYCQFSQSQLLAAKDLLTKSLGLGLQAAAIELSTTYRQLGKIEQAQNVLKMLDFKTLNNFDRALAEREYGVQLLLESQLLEAINAFERAWSCALATTQASSQLRSSVAHILATAYGQRGLDQQAAHYCTVALESAPVEKRIYPLMSSAGVFIYTGQYVNATNALLEAQNFIDTSQHAQGLLAYSFGLLHRAQGHWMEALEAFRSAARLARTSLDTETEFFAELGKVSIETSLGHLDVTRGSLARARGLAKDARRYAFWGLREAAMLIKQGKPEVLEKLQVIFEAFEHFGMRREAAWTQLHICEAHLKQGNTRNADAALDAATDIRFELGSGSAVVIELRGLPLSFDRLAAFPKETYAAQLFEDWRALEGTAPVCIKLKTLGEHTVLCDDRSVKLVMRRALEIISYLLLNPDVTRDQLLGQLWPDDAPNAAANYLHQTRHELPRIVPGLTIAFNKVSKTYAVVCQGPRLYCDILELKHFMNTGNEDDTERAIHAYKSFLPQAESQWAQSERETLEQCLIEAGLRLITSWNTQNQLSRCMYLSKQMLKIKPWNQSIAEHFIHFTLQVDGRAAAEHAIMDILKRYEDEMGHVPLRLIDLTQMLNAAN